MYSSTPTTAAATATIIGDVVVAVARDGFLNGTRLGDDEEGMNENRQKKMERQQEEVISKYFIIATFSRSHAALIVTYSVAALAFTPTISLLLLFCFFMMCFVFISFVGCLSLHVNIAIEN